MRDKVSDTILKYALFSQGDHVAVGLSGGADSVALLRILLELKEELGITVSAVHINHSIRGEESDADEKFCRDLCESLGVALEVCRCDVPTWCRSHGVSLEEGARAMRYDAFSRLVPNGLIATAHHIEDSAETVLLNLVRGTGLDGLCGIPIRRGNIVRPLLHCTRSEIEDYLNSLGQPWCEDSTNADDFASRNRLRHDVVPVLRELNPAFFSSVARMTNTLNEDRALLDALADELWEKAFSNGALDRKILLENARPLRLRVLRRLLRSHGVSVDTERLDACDAIVEAGEGTRPLAHNAVFTVTKKQVRVEGMAAPEGGFALEFSPDFLSGVAEIDCAGEKTLKIRIVSEEERKLFVNNRTKEFKNLLDCDRIDKSVMLRYRRSEDKFRPYGFGQAKSVNKLLGERKIPLGQRETLIMLESGGELLWIEKIGVSDRAAASDETTRAALLTVVGKEK